MKSCVEIRADILDTYHNNYKSGIPMKEPIPCVCIIQVGNNPASNAYVRGKLNDCEYSGIKAYLRVYPESITEQELIGEVKQTCNGSKFTGVIVQLPLPAHINAENVMKEIPPEKDIDGFNPESKYTACTPKGIMMFLDTNRIDLDGKHCVIINRSRIVGKPLINLFLGRNATVTVCHSHTKNLAEITRQADILVTAVGKENFITQDMIKRDVIILDVGITQDSAGKMCGDVAKDVECFYKTPVPKGVGLLTRTAFVLNCAESKNYSKSGERYV